jgi:hypothetical protein
MVMSVHEVTRYTKIQIRNKILITGNPLVLDVLDTGFYYRLVLTFVD